MEFTTPPTSTGNPGYLGDDGLFPLLSPEGFTGPQANRSSRRSPSRQLSGSFRKLDTSRMHCRECSARRHNREVNIRAGVSGAEKGRFKLGGR
jgi:hypothetical protein